MSIRSELRPSFYSGMILGMKSMFIMTEIKILCKMFLGSILKAQCHLLSDVILLA